LTVIDILSSGRLFAGVGPGSYKGDYDVCGIAFEDRCKRLDESLQILKYFGSKKMKMRKIHY